MPVLAAAKELPINSAILFPLYWERKQGQECLRLKERDESKQQTSKLVFIIRPRSVFKDDFIFLSEIVSELAYLFISVFLYLFLEKNL